VPKFTRTDSSAPSILIIENDPLMLTAMAAVMHMQDYRAVLARTEEIAVGAIAEGQFDVIVLSIEQLDQGCQFAGRLRSTDVTRDVPIIFLVPALSAAWSSELASQGGVFSMQKPVDPHELVELVEKALWMPHVAKSRMGAPSTHLGHQNDWISLSDSSH